MYPINFTAVAWADYTSSFLSVVSGLLTCMFSDFDINTFSNMIESLVFHYKFYLPVIRDSDSDLRNTCQLNNYIYRKCNTIFGGQPRITELKDHFISKKCDCIRWIPNCHDRTWHLSWLFNIAVVDFEPLRKISSIASGIFAILIYFKNRYEVWLY